MSKKSIQLFIGIIFLVSAIVLVLHNRYFNIIVDDAYISFRYAYNWAVGNGLVFNPGEHVEGYTNFLWVLILGLAYRLGVEIPAAAQWYGILFSIGCLFVVYKLGQTFQSKNKAVGLLAVFFLAINGSFAFWATGGLEVPLFTFVVLAASYIFILSQINPNRRLLLISSVLWGLGYLSRPEGALLFAFNIFFLFFLIMKNHNKRRWADLPYFILAGSSIIASHILWRLSYYGYPFPNTFYAKVGSDFTTQIFRGLVYTGDFFKAYGLIFVSIPIVFFVRRSALKFPVSYLLLLSGGYLIYIVSIGGDSLQNFRFIVPVLPFLYLITLDSWCQILTWPRVASHRQWPTRLISILSISIIGLCSILTFYVSTRGIYLLEYASVGGTWVTTSSVKDINLGWKQAGMWLKSNTPVGYKIAVQPAGYIPFYSQRFTLDMLGLSDTHIAHLPIKAGGGKAGHEKWDGDYILSRHPDIIILGGVVYPKPIGNLTDRAEIEKIIQPRRVDWELWGSPEFMSWYKPASVLLPDGYYFNYFIKRDEPVNFFQIPTANCKDLAELPFTSIDETQKWTPFTTNNVPGLLQGNQGSITFSYPDNPQQRDLYTFEFILDPAISNVIALKLKVNIDDGTYLTIEARPPNQGWKKFLSYYRGYGTWETVSFPVDVEPLRAITVSLREPGLVKNAGLTYRVSFESISALICQFK